MLDFVVSSLGIFCVQLTLNHIYVHIYLYVCFLINPPFHFSETSERKAKVIIYKIRWKKDLNSMKGILDFKKKVSLAAGHFITRKAKFVQSIINKYFFKKLFNYDIIMK